MFNKIKLLTLSLVCISQFTYAELIVTGDCNVSNATLTTIQISNLDISEGTGDIVPVSPNLLENGPYNASECIGIYAGNDSDQTANNIGEFEDGLLNGEDSILTGYEFIDDLVGGLPGFYDGDPLDIDGDTIADDPGWIHLAKFDVDENSTTYSDVTNYDQSQSLLISDVLKLTFSCSGNECATINWTLTTDIDIAQTVEEVLGRSTFDHLAFVAKAGSGNGNGNQDDKGWAIYDFNFYEIFANETPGAFNFDTAYSLSGSLNIKPGDFSAGLSHLTVWARDPKALTTQIPEPSSIAIFGLSLVLLSMRRKQV